MNADEVKITILEGALQGALAAMEKARRGDDEDLDMAILEAREALGIEEEVCDGGTCRLQ